MMLAKDLLALSRKRPSLVTADAALTAVIDELVTDRRTREVYVVDEGGRFVGVLTLRRLARFVFAHSVTDPSPTDLLELLSAENAGHLALKKASFVRDDDSLEDVVSTMFRSEIDEIAVLDENDVVVGCLDLLDILAAWRQGRLDLGS